MNHMTLTTQVGRGLLSLLSALCAVSLGSAHAQDNQATAQDDKEVEMEVMTVTGTRFPTPASELPISITIITADEIQANPVFAGNIQNGLSQLIPGGTLNEVGSSDIVVRGRTVSYRVNGIEMNQRGRASDIAVQDLEPSSFANIDVVRGADAAFGFGFNGGSINFNTRRPTRQTQLTSLVGIDFQTTDVGDSFGWRFRQDAAGTVGNLGYAIGGSGRFTGNQFDSQGNVFPDTNSRLRTSANVFAIDGALQYRIGDNHELETTQYYYTGENDPEFRAVGGDFSEGILAGAEPIPDDAFDASSKATNYMSTYSYRHDDLFGSRLDVTGFIQDGEGRFSTDRPGVLVGTRNETNSRYGVRTSVQTPLDFLDGSLLEGTAVVYGVDYQSYEYERTQITGPFGQDGVPFPTIEETVWSGHGQARIPVGDHVVITGGVRYETGSFTLGDVPNRVGRAPFEGGSVDFETLLFNAAVLYDIDDVWAVYFAFSQSAGVLDMGRGSRLVNRAVDLDPELDPTNQYEVGVRTNYNRFTVTLAGFYSESSRGQTFTFDPVNQIGVPLIAPIEIWGFEMTVDAILAENLDVGGTFSFSDGTEERSTGTVNISNTTIQPPKFTGYIEYRPTDWWTNRLTATHQVATDAQQGRIDAGLPDGRPLDAVTFINFFSSFDLKFVPGEIDIGIENILNRDEVDIVAQSRQNDNEFYLYPGRRIRIDYRLNW